MNLPQFSTFPSPMRYLFPIVAVFAAGAVPAAQAGLILAYTPGNGASVAPAETGAGVSGNALSRGSGLEQNAGSDFNSRDWTIGGSMAAAVAAGDFLQWGFSSGSAIDLTNLQIRYDRSNTGPSSLAIEIATNGSGVFTTFHTDTGVDPNGEENAIDLRAFTGVVSAQFRLAGWNATSGAGTFDIEGGSGFSNGYGLVVNGDVAAVPEPGSMLLFGLVAAGGAAARRRRRRAA